MRRQIYRQEALERMGSPEQLDQLMAVTGPRGWIALAGVGLVLLVAVLWSVLGQVATTVEGHGTLVRLGGVKPVPAPVTGEVAAVLVRVGQDVQQGAEVLRLIPEGVLSPQRVVTVRSPIDGKVLDVAAFEGDVVQEQAILLTVESSRYPLEAVVYLPAADGHRVQEGQEARVLLATAEQRTSTHLRGRVRVAGKFPASRTGMTRSAYQGDWSAGQATLGPMLEVVVAPAGGKWPSELYSGIPCQTEITVDRQRPIQLALPILSDGGGN
jgi:hypothetical protein